MGKCTFRQECPACNVQVIWMNGVIFKRVGLRLQVFSNKDIQGKTSLHE